MHTGSVMNGNTDVKQTHCACAKCLLRPYRDVSRDVRTHYGPVTAVTDAVGTALYCLTVLLSIRRHYRLAKTEEPVPSSLRSHPSEEHAKEMTQILCQLPADTSAAPSSHQLQTWRPISAPDDSPASSAFGVRLSSFSPHPLQVLRHRSMSFASKEM